MVRALKTQSVQSIGYILKHCTLFDTFWVVNRRKCRQLLRLRIFYIFRESVMFLRNAYNPLERLIISAVDLCVIS